MAEVATAAVHLAALGACFEDRRPEVRDEHAERTLHKVIEALDIHYGRFRKQQLMVERPIPALVEAVADVYRRVRMGLSDAEQRAELSAGFRGRGFDLDPRVLQKLVVSREAVASARGAKMTAQKKVGAVFGMSQTAARNSPSPAEDGDIATPLAFNMGVSAARTVRYLLKHLGWTDDEIREFDRLADRVTLRKSISRTNQSEKLSRASPPAPTPGGGLRGP